MDAEAIREQLAASLADQRLSRAERQNLSAALHETDPSPGDLAALRRLAFEQARQAMASLPAASVLEWLEDVVALLCPQPATDVPDAADACFSPGEACRNRIAGLFRTAARSVDACVYTITDNVISEAIMEAHRRGVRIRIISDDDKASDMGSDVVRFESAGIPVRVDRSKFHMHHKFAIFDRTRLLTGSYNWTLGAARDNKEHIVVLSDRLLIRSFEQEFERLWKEFA